MKIKDILAKIAKGTELTDAEKQFMAEFDFDKVANDAAAAARRKADEATAQAEKDRDALQLKIEGIQKKLDEKNNAGKSDLEKAQNQIGTLSKQIEDLTNKITTSEKDQAAMVRGQKLSDLRRTAGIQFVDGMDHSMLERSFASAFDGVVDLGDETVAKVKVATWRAMNKAAIIDGSGSGSGAAPHVGGQGGKNVSAVNVSGAALLDKMKNGSIEDAEAALAEAETADDAGKLTIS